jgi:hypothetical protein
MVRDAGLALEPAANIGIIRRRFCVEIRKCGESAV